MRTLEPLASRRGSLLEGMDDVEIANTVLDGMGKSLAVVPEGEVRGAMERAG